MSKLAICAIFKNEAPFLVEWIAYHCLIGFSDFYLFDNESSDGGAEIVRSIFDPKYVRIINWPFRPGQTSAYQYFCENFASNYEWVAFIDVDEFLHPLEKNGLGDVLAGLAGYSSVLINWLNFGSSGHFARPDGLVLENYVMRLPDDAPTHRHVKSIVRGGHVLGEAGSHVMRISGQSCDACGNRIENIAIQPVSCQEKLVINHYYTKSRFDWEQKVLRGRASTVDPKIQMKLAWFDEQYERVAQVYDGRILSYVPQLKGYLSGSATVLDKQKNEIGPELFK